MQLGPVLELNPNYKSSFEDNVGMHREYVFSPVHLTLVLGITKLAYEFVLR